MGFQVGGRDIRPMMLIMIPILLLFGVGILYNNFTASGFSTTPASSSCTALNCPAYDDTTGCNASPNPCGFSGSTTFSFLNPNSPFSLLVQGNFVGFYTDAFTQGETANVINSGYTYCVPQINSAMANATGGFITNFECLGYTAVGAGTHPFPVVGIPMNSTSNNGNNSVWSVAGCALSDGNYPCTINYGDGPQAFDGTLAYSSFYAFYVKNGTSLTASGNCNIFGSAIECLQLLHYLFTTGTTYTCPSTSDLNVTGIIASATTYYCLLPVSNANIQTSSSSVTTTLPNSFALFSFLFGVILLFMGLGLSLSTAIMGFSVNEQGTKLAQIFGISIVVYSFAFNEFSGWLGILGFGIGAALTIIFSAIYFVGVTWQSQSLF